MLAAVVVVAAEDITIPMRDMVRIIVVRVVVKGMGGQLMNDGGDCWTPTPSHFFRPHSFFLFIVQFSWDLLLWYTGLLSLSSTVIDSTHYLIVYIHISTFHPAVLAAKMSTLTTSGAPVSSSSTDENKAVATLPARWAFSSCKEIDDAEGASSMEVDSICTELESSYCMFRRWFWSRNLWCRQEHPR